MIGRSELDDVQSTTFRLLIYETAKAKACTLNIVYAHGAPTT